MANLMTSGGDQWPKRHDLQGIVGAARERDGFPAAVEPDMEVAARQMAKAIVHAGSVVDGDAQDHLGIKLVKRGIAERGEDVFNLVPHSGIRSASREYRALGVRWDAGEIERADRRQGIVIDIVQAQGGGNQIIDRRHVALVGDLKRGVEDQRLPVKADALIADTKVNPRALNPGIYLSLASCLPHRNCGKPYCRNS